MQRLLNAHVRVICKLVGSQGILMSDRSQESLAQG